PPCSQWLLLPPACPARAVVSSRPTDSSTVIWPTHRERVCPADVARRGGGAWRRLSSALVPRQIRAAQPQINKRRLVYPQPRADRTVLSSPWAAPSGASRRAERRLGRRLTSARRSRSVIAGAASGQV